MSHLFISYARTDILIATALAELLDSEGFDVWWDQRIYVGQNFPDAIFKAIDESYFVIVLWTPNSTTSEWVQREATEGLRLKKLLPVCLGGATPPSGFNNVHTIKFENWPRLVEELFRGIGHDDAAEFANRQNSSFVLHHWSPELLPMEDWRERAYRERRGARFADRQKQEELGLRQQMFKPQPRKWKKLIEFLNRSDIGRAVLRRWISVLDR